MNYDNKFDKQWQNEGTAPTDTDFASTGGFKGGLKPPAQWFNWFWHKVIAAITELQTKLSTVDTNVSTKSTATHISNGSGTNSVQTQGTTAAGNYAMSTGKGTVANKDCQHVIGKYNNPSHSDTYAFVIGNGYSMTMLSNAHTVDWDGNAWYAGDVSTGTDGIPLAKIAYLKIATTVTSTTPKIFKTQLKEFAYNKCLILRIRDGGTAGVISLSATMSSTAPYLLEYVYSQSNYKITFSSDGKITVSTTQDSVTTNVEFLIISKAELTLTEVTS